MRRATGISLVLLGGGLAFGLSTCGTSSEECREARAQGRPDAEQACRGGSGSGHGGSSSSSRSGSVTPVSERGGFGSHGFHFGGGS
jgi:hypothetical protein